jgi:cytochrome b
MSETHQDDGTGNPQTQTVKVWDPIVRLGHWLLVIGVFTAYFTGDEVPTVHIWAGYTVGIVLIIRLIWGVIGTKHAKFASFVKGPGAVWAYVSGLLNGRAERSIGHNAAGGAMIVALLLSLTGVTVSGLALQAVENGTGPLAGVISAPAEPVTTEARVGDATSHAYSERDEDDDDQDERSEGYGESASHEGGEDELYETLHSVFVYLTLALAGLHVLGVMISSLAHRENLAAAMVTGRKRQ